MGLRLEGIRKLDRYDKGWSDTLYYAVNIDEWDSSAGTGPGGTSWGPGGTSW
jgi:hypothetical protein